MNCHEVQELAFDYLNNEIDLEKRRQIQVHLAACETCRVEVDRADHLQHRIRQALHNFVLRNAPPSGTWYRLKGLLMIAASESRADRGITEFRRKPPPDRMTHGRRWLAPATALTFALVFMVVSQVFGAFQPLSAPRGYTTDMGAVIMNGETVRIRAAGDLEAAGNQAGFSLKAPPDLPDGYELREIHLAEQDNLSQAYLFYSGPGHDIIVSQVALQDSEKQSAETPGIEQSVLVNGRTESILIDGRPAAWEEPNRLAWQTGQVRYTVTGLGMGLEQATAIARTLK